MPLKSIPQSAEKFKILSWNVTKWNLFFNIILLNGAHTSSIGVAVLGSPWSKESLAGMTSSYKLFSPTSYGICLCVTELLRKWEILVKKFLQCTQDLLINKSEIVFSYFWMPDIQLRVLIAFIWFQSIHITFGKVSPPPRDLSQSAGAEE